MKEYYKILWILTKLADKGSQRQTKADKVKSTFFKTMTVCVKSWMNSMSCLEQSKKGFELDW